MKKINKVLIIGSGALKIGEAGEFDYSGSQALKALKEENIYTILINPNIATVQTSQDVADKIYFLPITPYFVEQIIIKDRPDGIMLSFGGQTALNCGIELYKNGIFDKYDIQVLGTPVQSIINTEDRELFVKKLKEINIYTPNSIAVTNLDSAIDAANILGFPLIIRAAFTLGGQGSGFCNNIKELTILANKAFSYSKQILIEESLKGWKEIEYEIVRDNNDNCIAVCNMENFDPLGIHTGESIVVAPSQTLSNHEYQKLRNISLNIVRHIGIIGECNVQFALDPNSNNYRVIEVNARLSRSSALASKATGYPLAFVAAKLGLGYKLYEIKNEINKITTAFFEPSLDYVVCKIPRWDLIKFDGVSREINSSMKSVGEIMAIGKSFEECIQKGLRMIGLGMHGFTGNNNFDFPDIEYELTHPKDIRIFAIEQAFQQNWTVDEIYNLTKIDKWFLYKLKNIFDFSNKLKEYKYITDLDYNTILNAKKYGFSDYQIAKIILKDKFIYERDPLMFRNYRLMLNIKPIVKQIDTLAAEYPAITNYLYLTYHGIENDIIYENDKKSVIVLGSGAYRIGSSVEFDWCGVNALNTIRNEGMRSVMINYNPETVSTDYDICDRLYFDELSLERVLDIITLETPYGVILSTGGQIPNNLAMKLHNLNIPILGTSALSIDIAENRHSFSKMLDSLNIDQPLWKELDNFDDIYDFAKNVKFPLLIRPSYVLAGAAMNVVSNYTDLKNFLNVAVKVSKDYPVVVTKFIEDAKEIEIDAVAKKGEIIIYAISEHVEFAGVHSGDATIVFPPQKLYIETIRKIKKIANKISKELCINGPFNIQFLAKDNDIKVIECNLRSSRSFPFVSKILKTNFIDIATKIMLNRDITKPDKSIFDLDYVGVKASQFSFSRLQLADPILKVDMASTGEVACIGNDFYEALLKSMLSVGYKMNNKNVLISSGTPKSKVELLEACRKLINNGYNIYATKGTHLFFVENDIPSVMLYWPDTNLEPNVNTFLLNKEIDLVINIPKNLSKEELDNDYTIRRFAIDMNIPLLTNARLASAFIHAITTIKLDDLEIKSWDEY